MEQDFGQLRVQVTMAKGGAPIADAYVTIFSVDADGSTGELLATRTTDSSGLTEPVLLATPPLAASFDPALTHAGYETYSVGITKPNFHAVQTYNVAMFPDTASVLPMHLDPLEESEIFDAPTVYRKNPLQHI